MSNSPVAPSVAASKQKSAYVETCFKLGTHRAVALWGSGLYTLELLAASYWGTGPSSTNAAFALRPSALRGASGGAGACL
jgi:hypothetical protein